MTRLNKKLLPMTSRSVCPNQQKLAAVGCGEYESVQAACEKLVHVVDTVEPDPVLVEKYEARYQEFRKLYPAVKEFF